MENDRAGRLVNGVSIALKQTRVVGGSRSTALNILDVIVVDAIECDVRLGREAEVESESDGV